MAELERRVAGGEEATSDPLTGAPASAPTSAASRSASLSSKSSSAAAPATSQAMSWQPIRSCAAWWSIASLFRSASGQHSHSHACMRLSVATRRTSDASVGSCADQRDHAPAHDRPSASSLLCRPIAASAAMLAPESAGAAKRRARKAR